MNKNSEQISSFLSATDSQFLYEHQQSNLGIFSRDLLALNKEQQRAVIKVMMGYFNEVLPKIYNQIFDLGWRFPNDFDLNNPYKYGYDKNGNVLHGNLAQSPNSLFSISIAEIKYQMDLQDTAEDLFGIK